jgi:hypothetical protein
MRHLPALLLLAPLVLAGATAPAHAAETCHGQTATILGTPDGSIVGTEGDDVVVTEGAVDVATYGGDDLVCVTGSPTQHSGRLWIRTGDGDDVVDSSAGHHRLRADLGKGVDAFSGGPGGEAVATGDGRGGESVSTGAGRDFVDTGTTGLPMDNTIFTGADGDVIHFRGLPGTGSINAGTERDTVYLRDRTRAAWRIDNRRSRIYANGASMRFVGAEKFETDGLKWRSLRFTGSSSAESLDLTDFGQLPADGPVQVELGGGRDVVWVDRSTRGRLDGGGGADLLVVDGFMSGATKGAARLDLRTGRTHLAGHTIRATSFTDLSLLGFDLNTVRGTAADNRLNVQGCRATVHAAGGADLVEFSSINNICDAIPAARMSLTAYGEGGPDDLSGDLGDDVLVGGPGSDVVKGGLGTDVCSAESTIQCP